jgi:hypothetical protein
MKMSTGQKTKNQMVEHAIVPLLPIAGQKFPQYLEGYLEFRAVRKNVYLFVSRFVEKSITIFRESLAEKHCSTVVSTITNRLRKTRTT